jgi:serine/threonine protein kinase
MDDLSIYHPSNLLYNQEKMPRYKLGGFHPICLGDTIKNGRYRVCHKLGWGGFSTVWLAWDRVYTALFAYVLPLLTNEIIDSRYCRYLVYRMEPSDTCVTHYYSGMQIYLKVDYIRSLALCSLPVGCALPNRD